MKRRIPYATIVIGVLCIAVFLVQQISGYADDTEGMILFGAYYKPFILAGEWWRFLTVGFVHANIWHLLINLMSLNALGSTVEILLKRWKFVVILLGSVAGGSLFVFAAQGNTVAVGLSGGLYGVMMSYVVIVIRNGGMKLPRVRYALLSTLMINLLINFMPGVSWIAHMGGAVTGALLTGILCADRDGKRKQRNYLLASVCLVICTGFMAYQNAYIPENQIYLLSDYHILMAEKQYVPASYVNGMAKKLDQIYSTGTVLADAVAQKED